MSKHVWTGSVWKKVLSGGYHVKAPTGVLKQVNHAWVWDGSAWKKYYTKAVPVGLTTTVAAWDKVDASWTSIASGATYILKRNGTPIYSGPNLSFQDTLLLPNTLYTYVIESYLGGTLMTTDTETEVTTPYNDLGLAASVVSYTQINLSWNAAYGSANRFELWQTSGTVHKVYDGTGTSYPHGPGLVAGTGYSYELTAFRGTTVIKKDTISATTTSRPTSTGSWNGPAATTSGGWTSCTARDLNGPTFPMPVNGYITSWNILIWSYGSATGRFNPHLGGQYRGMRDCPGGRTYQHVDGGNIFLGAGNQSSGASIGGNCSYSTEWDSYSGAAWNYNVAVGTVNYWWYTALLREMVENEPWWDERLEDKDVHMETWGVDKLTKVVITDKRTKSILVDWLSPDHDESLYV